jgi:hypothetical protein
VQIWNLMLRPPVISVFQAAEEPGHLRSSRWLFGKRTWRARGSAATARRIHEELGGQLFHNF